MIINCYYLNYWIWTRTWLSFAVLYILIIIIIFTFFIEFGTWVNWLNQWYFIHPIVHVESFNVLFRVSPIPAKYQFKCSRFSNYRVRSWSYLIRKKQMKTCIFSQISHFYPIRVMFDQGYRGQGSRVITPIDENDISEKMKKRSYWWHNWRKICRDFHILSRYSMNWFIIIWHGNIFLLTFICWFCWKKIIAYPIYPYVPL